MNVSKNEFQTDTRLLVKIEEAGRMLGFGRAKAYNMANAGELPGIVRMGRSVRVSVEALRTWVSQQATPGSN